MEEQQSGAITVIGSIAGYGYIGKMHIGYSTTKAALLNFAKCTAVQYASKGVRYVTWPAM
jgi:NAD(P)-dependent dehydrogenase (short-subunit alcohol dehydrogenase family)